MVFDIMLPTLITMHISCYVLWLYFDSPLWTLHISMFAGGHSVCTTATPEFLIRLLEMFPLDNNYIINARRACARGL